MKNIMRLRENIFFSSSWFPWRTQPDETGGEMKRTKRQRTTEKKKERQRKRERERRERKHTTPCAAATCVRGNARGCVVVEGLFLSSEIGVAIAYGTLRRPPSAARGTHVSHAHTRVSCCGAPTGRGQRTRGRRFGVRTLSKNITDHDVECEEGRVPTLICTCRALGRCNRGADRAYVGGSRSRKFEPMHWAL